MEYPIEALATCLTGIGLGNFGTFHQCAEDVLGGPVWVHEFALDATWTALRREVLALYPDMADVEIEPGCKVSAVVAGLRDRFGASRTVTRRPTDARTRHPLDTAQEVAGEAPVVVVVAVKEGSS